MIEIDPSQVGPVYFNPLPGTNLEGIWQILLKGILKTNSSGEIYNTPHRILYPRSVMYPGPCITRRLLPVSNVMYIPESWLKEVIIMPKKPNLSGVDRIILCGNIFNLRE